MKKLTIAYLVCLAYFAQDVQAFQYGGGAVRDEEEVGEKFINVTLVTLNGKRAVLNFDSSLGFEAFSDAVFEAVRYRDGKIILSGKIISEDNFDEYVSQALNVVTTLHVVEVLNEEEKIVRDAEQAAIGAERAAIRAAREEEEARLAQEKEKEDREEALELGFDERSLRDSGASENEIKAARNVFLESERMGLQLAEQEIARQKRERLIAEDLQQRQQQRQQQRAARDFIHVTLVRLDGKRASLKFDSSLGFEAFSDAVFKAVGYRDGKIILLGEIISEDNFDEYVSQALDAVTTLHVVQVLNEEEEIVRDAERAAIDAERAAIRAARDAEKARIAQEQ